MPAIKTFPWCLGLLIVPRKSYSPLGKIGPRSSFRKAVFADKKVINFALCFMVFVVYPMRNPVVYRTPKKVLLEEKQIGSFVKDRNKL